MNYRRKAPWHVSERVYVVNVVPLYRPLTQQYEPAITTATGQLYFAYIKYRPHLWPALYYPLVSPDRKMEGLGDGSASNGSRSSTVSNAGIEDAFAGAILPAGEEVHPGSVSTIHNNGRQVRIKWFQQLSL